MDWATERAVGQSGGGDHEWRHGGGDHEWRHGGHRRAVLAGLDIGPGDEIVTSDSEHPGLIGPLIAARAPVHRARCARWPRLADVRATHHDAGGVLPRELTHRRYALAALGEVSVPVVLAGAQRAGAVPVDANTTLGCAAYAAAGQKWMCGADGIGTLYLEPGFAGWVRTIAASYMSLEDPSAG